MANNKSNKLKLVGVIFAGVTLVGMGVSFGWRLYGRRYESRRAVYPMTIEEGIKQKLDFGVGYKQRFRVSEKGLIGIELLLDVDEAVKGELEIGVLDIESNKRLVIDVGTEEVDNSPLLYIDLEKLEVIQSTEMEIELLSRLDSKEHAFYYFEKHNWNLDRNKYLGQLDVGGQRSINQMMFRPIYDGIVMVWSTDELNVIDEVGLMTTRLSRDKPKWVVAVMMGSFVISMILVVVVVFLGVLILFERLTTKELMHHTAWVFLVIVMMMLFL